MGTFPTSDGHMNLAAPGTGRFHALCKTIGADELAEDPAYATSALRSANRDALNEAIAVYTATQPTSHWVQVLNEASIPCGPIYSIAETFADPQVQHLAMSVPVEHVSYGELNIVRHPVSLSRTPHHVRSAAPERGQHTAEVLAEAGLEPDRISDLRSKGAI